MDLKRIYRKNIIIIIITSARDLQPSTAISNQLPGQSVSTQITTKVHHGIENA